MAAAPNLTNCAGPEQRRADAVVEMAIRFRSALLDGRRPEPLFPSASPAPPPPDYENRRGGAYYGEGEVQR